MSASGPSRSLAIVSGRDLLSVRLSSHSACQVAWLSGLLLLALALVPAAVAQTVSFTVTTLTDDVDSEPQHCNQTQGGAKPSSNCSLRDALGAADALNSGNPITINFDAGLASTAKPSAYTLGQGGALMNYSSVNIVGPGPLALTISGGGKYAIFVFAGANSGDSTVSVSGLTLSNGYGGDGGAITSYVDLTLDNCILTGNSVSDDGGALMDQGPSLHVTNSIITGNSSLDSGAIYNYGSVMTIDDSTISNNTALDAGAIQNSGALTITNSVFSGNSSTLDDGGGIDNFGGSLNIDSSFFLGNSTAARGGAISTGGLPTNISNTVISRNSAPPNQGSGIFNLNSDLTLTNDIIPDAIVGAYTGSVSTGPVTAPGLALQGTPVVVTRGSSSGNTSTITITPAGGLTGTVALTATVSSAPAGAVPLMLSFGSTSPLLLPGTKPATATLTVSTVASTANVLSPGRNGDLSLYASGGAGLALLFFCGYPARRRRSLYLTGVMVLSAAVLCALSACGGGGSSQPTTPGDYTIQVSAISGTTSANCTIAVTVQ